MEPMKSCTTKGTKDHEGFWLYLRHCADFGEDII